MTAAATAATATNLTADEVAGLNAIDRPTKRDEAWRYAPHLELDRLVFGAAAEPHGDLPAEVAEQIPAVAGHRILLVNGLVATEHSRLDGLPESVAVSSLAEAADDRPELLEGTSAGGDVSADAFDSLNASFSSDGVVIDIQAGNAVETPLHIVHAVLPAQPQNASCGRVVVNMGPGSSATVFETRVGGGDEFGASNTRTTIRLDDEAALEHVVLQDAPEQQIHLARVDVDQSAGSTFTARSFNLGGLYGRLAYHVHLGGAGALADLSGLYFGFGDQILDQQVTIVHATPDCTSRQSFRGVLDEESTGVFNGGIDVRPGADGTEAEQSNANLLLSRRAEANTQPRLEILADDVKCKHGATVGQLDEEALYYMRSRGIDADDARRMLVAGFADVFVDAVGDEAAQDWIRQRLRRGDG
ncbi:MAG: Fe-S cluster assembly protein SufD [Microthrixaceae bacterium]